MNASLFIGIEHFDDTKISDVKYAVNDARAVAAAFEKLGYPKATQEFVLDGEATMGRVKYEISELLKGAQKDDSVLIFFSSHGVSVGGTSYLVCKDTVRQGVPATGIPIKEVFEMMNKTKSEKVILLLDCCHAGLQFPEGEKSLMGTMSNDEIAEFFSASTYRVAFASCADTETSSWSNISKQGIWTTALLKALNAEAKHILEKNRFLRAANLQDYLFKEVPLLVRNEYNDGRVQTPQLYGSLTNNFLVADMEPLLTKQVEGIGDLDQFLKGIKFIEYKTASIGRLPGFKKSKGHTVPENFSAATEKFVRNIAGDLITDPANKLVDQIIREFGYNRSDIKFEPNGSSALIHTKDFEVVLYVAQREDEPSLYEEVLSVSGFSSAAVIMSDPFNEVFHGEVSILEVNFKPAVKIAAVIDQIQHSENTSIKVKSYEHDNSACIISIAGVSSQIELRPQSTSMDLSGKRPKEMIEIFTDARSKALMDAASVLLLPTIPVVAAA